MTVQIRAIRDMAPTHPAARLKGWKQIAGFFGTDESTVRRWEANRNLPVHRVPGGARASVYANAAELEHWLGSEKPAATIGKSRIWIFATAATVALLVSGGVGLELRGDASAIASPARHQPTQAVADLYFAGRYNLERRSSESLDRAVALFTEAIRRDPAYAEAYAGLANCHLLMREYAGAPDAVAYPRARDAAERALALDDSLADAHSALAYVVFFYDRNFTAGLAGFRRAIVLNPASGSARHWYASALYHDGQIQEALAQIDEAQRLEPQSQSILADKALIMFAAGNASGAIALLRQMEAADPDYLSPHAYLAAIHFIQADYPASLAEQHLADGLAGDTDRASVTAAAERGYAQGGAPSMFEAMLARQRTLYAAGREHAFDLAATYALAGQRGRAMDALREAVRDRDHYLIGLRIDSRFAGLRRDPEFQRLARGVSAG